jgi:hypothetical protein
LDLPREGPYRLALSAEPATTPPAGDGHRPGLWVSRLRVGTGDAFHRAGINLRA